MQIHVIYEEKEHFRMCCFWRIINFRVVMTLHFIFRHFTLTHTGLFSNNMKACHVSLLIPVDILCNLHILKLHKDFNPIFTSTLMSLHCNSGELRTLHCYCTLQKFRHLNSMLLYYSTLELRAAHCDILGV